MSNKKENERFKNLNICLKLDICEKKSLISMSVKIKDNFCSKNIINKAIEGDFFDKEIKTLDVCKFLKILEEYKQKFYSENSNNLNTIDEVVNKIKVQANTSLISTLNL